MANNFLRMQEEGVRILTEREYREKTAPFPHEVALQRLKGEFPDFVDESLSKNEQLTALLLKKIQKLELEQMFNKGRTLARDTDVSEVKAENKDLRARIAQLERNENKLQIYIDRLQSDNEKLKSEAEPTRDSLKRSQSALVRFRPVTTQLMELGWDLENFQNKFKRIKQTVDESLQGDN
jgi:chromosome segregation ATPase